MGNTRHEVADDGIGIFDLRFSQGFRKRLAGYDKREVELFIRRQEAIMTKIRLEKEQLERQVIRLRQELSATREKLAEAQDATAASRPIQREPDLETSADVDDTSTEAPEAETTNVTDIAAEAAETTTSTDEAEAPRADEETVTEPATDGDEETSDDDDAATEDAADAESEADETAEVKATA